MNNSQNNTLSSYSINNSRLALLYPSLLQNFSLLNQQHPHHSINPFDHSMNDASYLEKRKFQSLDSAFSKATEKKLNTGLNEALLSAMLNDTHQKPQAQFSPQNVLENTILQEQVSKVYVNQLQFEMNKFKDYHNFLGGNTALNQNIMLQKMAFLNKTQQNSLFTKSANLFKAPEIPKDINFREELENANISKTLCELHKVQNHEAVSNEIKIVAKVEASEIAEKNSNEDIQTDNTPINVEEPALVAFTRDFPTWDLAKIFSYVNKGKTKEDLVQRPSRSKAQRVSYTKDLEDFPEEKIFKQKPKKKTVATNPKKTIAPGYKEDDLVILCKFQQDLYKIFGPSELDQNKVLEILKNNQMNLEKAVNSIKKNFIHYQNELVVKKDV